MCAADRGTDRGAPNRSLDPMKEEEEEGAQLYAQVTIKSSIDFSRSLLASNNVLHL